ncbi:MAG: S8 family serine peptidase [Candidatus Altiarchaeota archaeon]|nr:S8 family serine peptidase [Candidatus Altiarchaeota archaeon]
MKRFILPLFFLLTLLLPGLMGSGGLINKHDRGDELRVREGVIPGDVLDLSKFHIPPEMSAYIQKKYPGGLVTLPLDSRDEILLSNLKQSGYILQFKGKPLHLYKKDIEEGMPSKGMKSPADYERDMRVSHTDILQKLHSLHSNPAGKPRIKEEFFNIFNGVSIRNISQEDILKLSSLDYVEKIYPIKEYHMLLSDSVPMIGATDVWGIKDPWGRDITGVNVTIAIIDTGIDYTHADLGNCTAAELEDGIPYSLDSDHPYSNYENLTWVITQPGFTNIAVHFSKIDVESGWDYLYILNSSNDIVKTYSGYFEDVWSPSVSGDTIKINLVSDSIVTKWGFSVDGVINSTVDNEMPNCSKVVGGYDFVSNDPDPMDDQGHGTHCAGIAAGNGSLLGVAPGARLLAYKVLDYSGGGYEDDIIAAIDKAVVDGADVISLSLGGSGDPDDALSLAIDNAVDSGVLAVVAAGNSGPGNQTIKSPGCARKALTVGAIYKEGDSSGNSLSRLCVVTESNKEIDSLALAHSALTPKGGLVSDLESASLGLPENFIGKDFTGKIALIKRGDILFSDKVKNAYNAGASGAIIYNNYYGNFKGDLINLSDIPAVSVSESDGQYLLSLIENGSVTVNMSVTSDPNVIADFSSRGPSYILNKPDVVAPGVDICSARWGLAFPGDTCIDDTHVSLSGTSMATPHVAGAAALLLQKNPDWSPLEVKAAFENTAYDYGVGPNTQGAGGIDVLSAVQLSNSPPIAFISDLSGARYGK